MLTFALQTVAAFNLVCTGTYQHVPVASLPMPPPAGGTPFTIIYRVDLESRRYCADTCTTTEALASVTDTMITFRLYPLGNEASGDVSSVNRETGMYTSVLIIGSGAIVSQGTCERAPFTGFPQRRF